MRARRIPELITAFFQEKTVREWVDDHRCSVCYQTLYTRIDQGWDPEEAIRTPRIEPRRHKAFGKLKTIGEWAQDPRCVVKAALLASRIARDWTMEAAMTKPASIKHSKYSGPGKRIVPDKDTVKLAAFGEKKTLQQWADDTRSVVPYYLIRDRLRKGWALEDALAISRFSGPAEATGTSAPGYSQAGPQRVSSKDVYSGFGETKTVGEWAADQRCAVCPKILADRLRDHWPLEEALTTGRRHPGVGPRQTFEAFGECKTVGQWAKDPRCVVSLRNLQTRISRGVDPESALTAPVNKKASGVEAFGECKSVFRWSQDSRCTVSQSIISKRLYEGWPPEAAVSAPVGATLFGLRLSPLPLEQRPVPQTKNMANESLVECFGEYKTITAWSRDPRCVVTKHGLLDRMRRGIPIEDAITRLDLPKKPPPPRGRLYEAFGEAKTIGQWAKDPRCIVKLDILKNRVNGKKMPMEEALVKPRAS